MDPTLPLILLLGAGTSSPSALPPPLTSGERRALARFSAQWSVRFIPVLLSAAPPNRPIPPGAIELPERIEGLLRGAREALARLNDAEARALLETAGTLIREHPELPQAAWLLAEQLTLLADIADEAGDGTAPALRSQASALEGARVPPLRDGETAGPPLEALQAPVVVELRGLDSRDVLEWDGVRATAPIRAVPGQHAARVLRRNELVWAGWVTVVGGAPATVGAPPITPCSAEDLHGLQTAEQRPRIPEGVLCSRWAVARRGRHDELELAACERSRCGAWQKLMPEPRSQAAPRRAAHSGGFPAWATVALAGVGAALTTSFVLWQTGAFEPRSTRERWIYAGHEERR